jgi:hypothetical protein
MIRIARVSFDNYVSIQNDDPDPNNRALVITRLPGTFDETAVNPSVTTINAKTGAIQFNPFATDGRYFNYDLTFSGPGVELSGSLQDGDYELTFDNSKVQSFLNLDAGNESHLQGGEGIQTLEFHRLFGDVNGDRVVDDLDKAFMDAAFRSRQGQANFREYLNFDWNRVIDNQDQSAFNTRFNRY